MKHIGIVAVSSEGAALCYRTICLKGAALLGPHEHPEITLHGFSLGSYQRLIDNDDWEAVGEMMLASAAKLVRSGAQLLICPDNTVHQGLDLVRDRSPAPWIHIAEEVSNEARQRGVKRLAILGTRFLMEGPVYRSKLAPAGIDHRVPNVEQRQRINQIIYDELVRAHFLSESRAYFQSVIRDLAGSGCDAVALACTEIPLLISPPTRRCQPWTRRGFSPVPLFASRTNPKLSDSFLPNGRRVRVEDHSVARLSAAPQIRNLHQILSLTRRARTHVGRVSVTPPLLGARQSRARRPAPLKPSITTRLACQQRRSAVAAAARIGGQRSSPNRKIEIAIIANMKFGIHAAIGGGSSPERPSADVIPSAVQYAKPITIASPKLRPRLRLRGSGSRLSAIPSAPLSGTPAASHISNRDPPRSRPDRDLCCAGPRCSGRAPTG